MQEEGQENEEDDEEENNDVKTKELNTIGIEENPEEPKKVKFKTCKLE